MLYTLFAAWLRQLHGDKERARRTLTVVVCTARSSCKAQLVSGTLTLWLLWASRPPLRTLTGHGIQHLHHTSHTLSLLLYVSNTVSVVPRTRQKQSTCNTRNTAWSLQRFIPLAPQSGGCLARADNPPVGTKYKALLLRRNLFSTTLCFHAHLGGPQILLVTDWPPLIYGIRKTAADFFAPNRPAKRPQPTPPPSLSC